MTPEAQRSEGVLQQYAFAALDLVEEKRTLQLRLTPVVRDTPGFYLGQLCPMDRYDMYFFVPR